ncbi:ATP-binding protein [Ancylomarina longa]|nr:ATP-binding protein [Ancylomarina longa]
MGYVFVFLAILASLFIAYQSYNKLFNSVVSLSKPDAEIARMNHILTSLSEAENQIRIYSLTKKERYLELYARNVFEIQSELDSLRHFNLDSSVSNLLIDSMNYLLNERADRLEKFVILKRNKEKENLSQKAIRQLSEVSDSAKTKIKTTTTTFTFLDTVMTAAEVKEKKQTFFNRLFKGKKAEERGVDSLETVVKRTEVKVDTSYLPQEDSLLRSLENMLQIAQQKEQLNRDIVSREELQLVEENSLIWDKIKLLLNQLEKERMQQLTKASVKAKQIASNSIFTISIIIMIAFVLGILFIIFILMDITKSNFYRKELLVAKGRAEKLAKVKEDFLSSMSHEIRTPLNAIIGFTNQLNKTKLEAQQQHFVKVLKNSSKHLLGLVNEILDLSKIEAGKLRIENIGFKPYSIISDVFDVLKINAELRKLDFTWEFQGDSEILLSSDPFRIKQIILNLGSNALKFTAKGSVKINAALIPQGDRFLFQVDVKDTGIGIADDKLETIFEDFSQADSFSARKYGGTGLGLAISRRLAHLLGGDLYVESEIGEGSCFTLRIPLAVSTHGEVVTTKQIMNGQVAKLQTKRFLIADDDEYSLLLIRTIFNGWKLKADFVEDGSKAWDLLQKNSYDMVLTDIHMPEMGGIELCRRIRNIKEGEMGSIPIVALTANVRESDLQKYIASGMTECLVKPFDEDILMNILNECLIEKSEINSIENSQIEEDSAPILFDLSPIKQFTSDDPELIQQIINQFIRSAEENIRELNMAYKEEDYLKVGSIAHKMLTSFNQLKVESVTPNLRQLEELLHCKSDVKPDVNLIKQLIFRVEKNTSVVISSIRNEIIS